MEQWFRKLLNREGSGELLLEAVHELSRTRPRVKALRDIGDQLMRAATNQQAEPVGWVLEARKDNAA